MKALIGPPFAFVIAITAIDHAERSESLRVASPGRFIRPWLVKKLAGRDTTVALEQFDHGKLRERRTSRLGEHHPDPYIHFLTQREKLQSGIALDNARCLELSDLDL
ncbi:hypothetical protein [Agromyces humatus]|uniref:hypothetical protein n=1 Tax=Agromyces humatus TaxID=279573 RepID=UPI001E323C9E|nr:hypothetical protein [Agromyces humatus]